MLDKIINENKPSGLRKTLQLGIIGGLIGGLIGLSAIAGFKYKFQKEIVELTNNPERKVLVTESFEVPGDVEYISEGNWGSSSKITPKILATRGIYDCSIIAIIDDGKNYLYHITPSDKPSNVAEFIDFTVQDLSTARAYILQGSRTPEHDKEQKYFLYNSSFKTAYSALKKLGLANKVKYIPDNSRDLLDVNINSRAVDIQSTPGSKIVLHDNKFFVPRRK